jgi:hypothetical protein
MPLILSALFGFLGSTVKGFFGFQGDQAQTVQKALDVLKSVNDSDGQTITAAAQSLSVILSQGSWLEKNWRPFLMLILMSIVVSFWFGYTPPQFNVPMSPMMVEIWGLLKIGLVGYLPCRTLEKIVQQINIGAILKTLVGKKI